jgi:hypothetical protein
MFPAAFVLPVWLLVGWIVFGAGAWALLFLFVAIPAVAIAQIVLTLLVRARASVRAERAVSWWDVAGFGVWHALVFATGCFVAGWFGATVFVAVAVAVALFWLTLWQLLREVRERARVVLRAADGTGYLPPERPRPEQPANAEVFVITEQHRPE